MVTTSQRFYGGTHLGATPMKPSNKKWLKVIEFTVVGFALWLNPSASLLIFLLKLCFQTLYALQKDEKK
jgi:hypothetical protein